MSRRTPSPFRSIAVLAVAALAGPALVATQASRPAAAAAAPRGRQAALDTVDTYTGLTFTVPAGTNDLGQPQTCTIDADLYKPHSASRTARVPAILTTNGFGGSKADQAGLGTAFAKRGYTVLSYTGLGFPDSGCKISLDDPGVDGVAASSLVTFLGGAGSRGIRLVAGGRAGRRGAARWPSTSPSSTTRRRTTRASA